MNENMEEIQERRHALNAVLRFVWAGIILNTLDALLNTSTSGFNSSFRTITSFNSSRHARISSMQQSLQNA